MRLRNERGERAAGQRPHDAALAALALATIALLAILAPSAHAAFGFKATAMSFEAQDESPASQAGSHPFAWRTTVLFDPEDEGSGGLRNLQIQVPPGLLGTPRLLPECEHSEFILNACPDSTALGILSLRSEGSFNGGPTVPVLVQAPVFNLEPLPGNGAELGAFPEAFNLALPLSIEIGISSTYPQRLTASLTNVSQVVPIRGYRLTLWGDPADPAHDPYRGACGAALELGQEGFPELSNGSCPSSASGAAPLLTLPSSCAPAAAGFEASAWIVPSAPLTASLPEALKPTGCGALSYTPTLTASPTTNAAAGPSGLDLDLDAPDSGIASATGRAAANTSSATLTLPPGLSINPPVAAGLAACTPAQLAAEAPDADPATGCPQASKLGTATVTTPLFAKPISGDLYAAEPDDPATPEPGAENPFDARFALYLVLRDPDRGVLLSLPIRIDADPATGRLTASFEQIPELPLSHLELHFNSGPHAPLATPPGCAAHTIAYSLTPSSGAPPLSGKDSFATNSNCAAPFAPTLLAGTTTYAAGRAAPFVLELANPAAAPNLSSLHLTLPPGLAADLSAATTCPEPDTATAACPPESRLGYARIALGAGPEPLWVPAGERPDSAVYLAGPDQGAPYSLLVSIPAAAGPYDLGQVILRAPVRLDPSTAQATVSLSDLPQILNGIPLHYRAIRLVLDRPGFIRNPTSCEPTQITAALGAADGRTAAAASRFQAADCAGLRFEPKVSLHLSRTSRNAHPALRATVRSAIGEAAISAASFTLPPGELLDLHRLRALCARGLPAAGCPAASRIGSVRLFSPMLPEALQGPIYLREPSKGLPELLAEVRGSGIDLILHGHTTSPAGRLRLSFSSLPDIPLSKAEITLPGGHRGIIANSRDLCAHRHHAAASLAAHSGKQIALRPKLGLSCWRLTVSHRHHRTQSTR